MSGKSLQQVQNIYTVQRQELKQCGTPNIRTFVGGSGAVSMYIFDTIVINLYPKNLESLLGFERKRSVTDDKLIVNDYGEIKILGVITLWLKLDSFYGRPTLTSFKVQGALETKWHLVDMDCQISMGRNTVRELNLNLEYPFEFLKYAQYVNWNLVKKPNGMWVLGGTIAKINPWIGDDIDNA